MDYLSRVWEWQQVPALERKGLEEAEAALQVGVGWERVVLVLFFLPGSNVSSPSSPIRFQKKVSLVVLQVVQKRELVELGLGPVLSLREG